MHTTNSCTKNYAIAALLIALFLGCLALSPNAKAALPPPPPDGGYAGNNTAEGTSALFSLTTGTNNTALGYQALFHNTAGSSNTAEGARALFFNTTGQKNTATGAAALFGNTTGTFNQADGTNALFNNGTGANNSANGSQTLFHNTTGGFNTGTGAVALFNATTASFNTADGCQALFKDTTGQTNTALGFRALFNNTTGGGNIAVGTNAGLNLTTGNNNIDIGSQGVAGESGMIRIGTPGMHTNTFLTGDVLVSGGTNPNLTVSGPGSAAVTLIGPVSITFRAAIDPSDFDFKIQDNTTGTPKTFINIDDTQGANSFIGFCGQLNAAFPIHVGETGDTTNGNGAHLTGAGVWTDASSRTFKENFTPVDQAAVLKKVTELPVRTWTYKGVPGVRHMGPVAEDFKDTFGLGDNEKYLASLDSAGVALAAIQGLNEVVKQKDTKIQELEKRLSRLEKMLDKAE